MKIFWKPSLTQTSEPLLFRIGKGIGGLFKQAHFGLIFVGLVALLLYANTWHNDITWMEAGKLTFGLRPPYLHWINTIIYAYAITIIWAIIFNLTNQKLELFPLVTALVFAVHPLHSSVVASVANREFLLAFLLGMTASIKMIAYTKTKRPLYLMTATLALAAAFIFHVSALLFMAIIPIFMSLYLKKEGVPEWTKKDTKKLLLLWACVVGAGIAVHIYMGAEWMLSMPSQMWDRLPMTLDMVGRYCWITFFPRHMIIDYGPQQIPLIAWKTASLRILSSILALTAFLIFAKINHKYRPWLSTGIYLWIVPILILSVGSWLFNFPMSETLAFIPSLGMAWITTWIILSIWDACSRIPRPSLRYCAGIIWLWCVLVILAGLSWVTINRNAAWKNTLTLCARIAPYMEKNALFHLMFGETLLEGIPKNSDINIQEKLLGLAAGEILMAIKLNPELGIAYFRLGQIYEQLNSTESARWAYRHALEFDKKHQQYILAKLAAIAEKQGDRKARILYETRLRTLNKGL